MAYIGKKPEDIIRGNASYNAFTGDGSTTTFDVTNLLPDGGQFNVEVFVDNVRQEAGSSKSYTIGQDGSGDLKRVTFNVAPDDGAEIYVINPGRETALITVADNTITTAKLQDDAVTTAKITDSNVTAAKLASTLDISSKTITLPNTSVTNAQLAGSIANSKLANSSITINGTAVSLGGSVTAGTDWQAVVVADGSTQLTAVAGRGYFLDTNAGVIEVKLPSSPSRGDTFIFADYGNNFATNRVVIDTGGKLIDSTQGGVPDSDFILATNGQVVEIVFADDTAGYIITKNSAPSDIDADSYESYVAATGGTVTTSGNFKTHVFTGDGNFVVSDAGNSAGSNTVDYLVVAGGGGGAGRVGGGGGAGGFRVANSYGICSPVVSPLANPSGIVVSATTYPISVGGGGCGAPSGGSPDVAGDGSNSVFATITSAGGGGGVGTSTYCGRNGGSGSGGAGEKGGSPSSGGSGNTPPVSPPQGNNGGTGSQGPSNRSGGGGGGAGAAGTNHSGQTAGPGGVGSYMSNTFFGPTSGCSGTTGPVSNTRYFAGGGGAGVESAPSLGLGTNGAGGSGGGGQGGPGPEARGSGVAGTANTGGGGGAGSRYNCNGTYGSGGAGGKGIVVLRYKFQ